MREKTRAMHNAVDIAVKELKRSRLTVEQQRQEFVNKMPPLANQAFTRSETEPEEGRRVVGIKREHLIQMAREIVNQPKIARRASRTAVQMEERERSASSQQSEQELIIPQRSSVSHLPNRLPMHLDPEMDEEESVGSLPAMGPSPMKHHKRRGIKSSPKLPQAFRAVISSPKNPFQPSL